MINRIVVAKNEDDAKAIVIRDFAKKTQMIIPPSDLEAKRTDVAPNNQYKWRVTSRIREMKKSEFKNLVKKIILQESEVSQQAKQMGLKYGGFGRWKDQGGKVTHKSQGGKLVPVGKNEPTPQKPDKAEPVKGEPKPQAPAADWKASIQRGAAIGWTPEQMFQKLVQDGVPKDRAADIMHAYVLGQSGSKKPADHDPDQGQKPQGAFGHNPEKTAQPKKEPADIDKLKNKIPSQPAVKKDPVSLGKPEQFEAAPRPKRMKAIDVSNFFQKFRNDRPVDYGHCQQIFIDKYGKEGGEAAYEKLFINQGSNFGWSLAGKIQKEKRAMIDALGFKQPEDLDTVAYYPLWKMWQKKEGISQVNESGKILNEGSVAAWHKKLPRPQDDPGWDHEKKRIESMSTKALLARIYKIGDAKKLYLFACALEDENYHDLAEPAFDRLERMKEVGESVSPMADCSRCGKSHVWKDGEYQAKCSCGKSLSRPN